MQEIERDHSKLKRQFLPSFKKIELKVDLEKLRQAFAECPMRFDDLIDGYKGVAADFPKDEARFGLAFYSREEAVAHCKEHNLPLEFDEQEPGKWRIPQKNILYQQMAVTEYDGVGNPHLETSYTKLVDWARGTYFEEIMGMFKGRVTRVRICRMRPSCVIKPHIDYNTDFAVRYHIAIYSDDKSYFTVYRKDAEPERFHIPCDGSIWFLNQGFYHDAHNPGTAIRDHLVLSVDGQQDLS